MIKNDYKVRAQKFVQQIFPYIDGFMYDDIEETFERVKKFASEKHRRVKMDSGISRIAIITADYVIKWDKDETHTSFAGDCEKEYLTWRWILDENPGYAYLFAEITKYHYRGENFYIMPRVRGINENRSDYPYEYVDEDEDVFLRKWFYDLHSGNFGVDRNGNVTIFDYAWNKLSFN